MNIQFTQPQDIDIERVLSLAEDPNSVIRVSPHVGNLDQKTNPHYLSLALGGVPLELVDTITINDRNGRPGLLVKGGVEAELDHGLTRKDKNRIHPCVASIGDVSITLLHALPLDQAGIKFTLSSRFPSQIHQDLPKALMLAIGNSAKLRVASNGVVSSDPQKRKPPTQSNVDSLGIYGQGQEPLSGLILPVEALVAAEVIGAAIKGAATTYHIGGCDVVKYMQEPGIQKRITDLASSCLAGLGLKAPQQINYRILNKNGGINGLPELSAKLAADIGLKNFSQHDLDRHHLIAQ